MEHLYHVHAALLAQSLGQRLLKGLLLLLCRHGHLGVEHAVQEGLGQQVGLAAVEQGVVKVGRPVVKGGEQEPVLRGRHVLGGVAVELVVPGVVAQPRLALLHRAHRAEDVGEHPVPVLQAGAVLGLYRHVVGVVGQQQQVAALQVQGLHGLLVKGLAGLPVLQARLPQGHQQFVLLAVHHLLGGEHQVDEMLPQPSGEGFLQQGEVLLRLLLGQHGQGLVQIGDELPPLVDKAPVDAAHRVFLRLPPAAQLRDLFRIHRALPRFFKKYPPIVPESAGKSNRPFPREKRSGPPGPAPCLLSGYDAVGSPHTPRNSRVLSILLYSISSVEVRAVTP